MSSIREVARHAGVGVATVSRALNGSGYVSPETMERIQRSIRELNYVPNELARNLYHQHTGIVALLVPIIHHPFFSTLIQHCECELAARGYKMMLCSTNDNPQLEQEYLQMLERNMVDGIISGAHSEDTRSYIRTARPLVAFDRYLGPNIPVVRSDHAEGGRLAAQALLDRGCRCILHCGFARGTPIEETMPFKEKDVVFERIIREAGVRHIGLEYIGPESMSEARLAAFLEQYPEIDGFFSVDNTAFRMLQLAARRGLRVPQDLAVVSYDGTSLTELGAQRITCVVQPLADIARTAVELLLRRIDGQPCDQHVYTLPVSLRQGDTA